MQGLLLQSDFLKEDYQKAFRKLTLFFLSSQVLLMNKIIQNKRGLELVTIPSLGYKTISVKSLYY